MSVVYCILFAAISVLPIMYCVLRTVSCTVHVPWWAVYCVLTCPLKYQNIWWGGEGDCTLHVIEWEEPPSTYTSFSPSTRLLGSNGKTEIENWKDIFPLIHVKAQYIVPETSTCTHCKYYLYKTKHFWSCL